MTNMHYDSDDARNRSPPLEPAHPDYQPRETPVPFVTDESQSPEAKPGGAGTDCADQEIIDGVECQSPGPNESEPVSPTEPLKREPRRQSESPKVSTQAAQNALDLINAEPDRPKPPSPSAIKLEKSTQEEAQPHFPVLPGVSHLESLADSSRRPGEGLGSIGGGLGRLSGILGPIHPLQCPPLPPIATDYREDRRPIATSPRLRPFAIPPSERTAGETLPALHSPPHSAAANSPETSLPSLKATFPDGLGDTRLNDQNLRRNGASSLYIPTSSPPRHTLPAPDHPPRRAEPFIPPPPAPGNPYMPLSRTNSKDMSSLASTPTAQSQPSPWNIPKSEMSFAHSSGDAASQTMGESPAAGGYPTPIEPRQLDHSEQKSRSEPPASGMAATAGGFKCTHPGCTAAPFQTQYLLNSHANVHSHDRPYFCPVKGCPRAEGGKGFKRKNEMIRHGLVHDSPGYVCPFCHDQQHKYPRPDNLQRHVRVHHVDKSKDDPLLRRVLAQRPEGLNRGRKRRI